MITFIQTTKIQQDGSYKVTDSKNIAYNLDNIKRTSSFYSHITLSKGPYTIVKIELWTKKRVNKVRLTDAEMFKTVFDLLPEQEQQLIEKIKSNDGVKVYASSMKTWTGNSAINLPKVIGTFGTDESAFA